MLDPCACDSCLILLLLLLAAAVCCWWLLQSESEHKQIQQRLQKSSVLKSGVMLQTCAVHLYFLQHERMGMSDCTGSRSTNEQSVAPSDEHG